jgi:hypothetical protein
MDGPPAMTLAFTTFVLFQFFNVVNARAERGTAFHRSFFSNRNLWLALTRVLVLQVLVVHWGPAQSIFHTTDLALADWGWASLVASRVLLPDEARKLAARSWPWQPTRSVSKELHIIQESPTNMKRGLSPHGFATRCRLASYLIYLPRPSPGLPQVFMANTASLLPGTLSTALDRSALKVSVLNRWSAFLSELEAAEQSVARIFGTSLKASGGGE